MQLFIFLGAYILFSSQQMEPVFRLANPISLQFTKRLFRLHLKFFADTLFSIVFFASRQIPFSC